MPRPRKSSPLLEGAEKVATVLNGFDYGVHAEDFVLYELHRFIEEDRASFDDAEFRTLIDEGIRAHVEDNIGIRALLAGMLRAAALTGNAKTVAMRVIRAVEDIEADLCNVAVLVRSYTAYLFSRLETLESDSVDSRIAMAADLLFESTGDRGTAEEALQILCGEPSPVSARVLAHAVSEPLLDEDLEARAVEALKTLWPLPRHYMFYNLRNHPHEDIPVRWFQIFVEMDELRAVELVLEELRAHAGNPRYQEDLVVLMDVLQACRDPEIEDKILDAINSRATNDAVLPLLRKFIEEHQPPAHGGTTTWTLRAQDVEKNRQYTAAAAAWDSGSRDEARLALEKILAVDSGYPFAVALNRS